MEKRTWIITSILVLMLLAGCAAAPTEVQLPSQAPAATKAAVATVAEVSVPTPTMTEEPTPAPTATLTPAPTQAPIEFTLLKKSAQYHTTSSFTLYASAAGGNYAAQATYNGGAAYYTCKFDPVMVNDLICTGGAVPFGKTVYVKVTNTDTNEVVYENTITFYGIVPTPTGMDCQVEPQWNGFIPAHQLNQECFALTCMQNGQFFYGNNNTCLNPWPFDWDFIHPLHTPYAPVQ